MLKAAGTVDNCPVPPEESAQRHLPDVGFMIWVLPRSGPKVLVQEGLESVAERITS